MLPEAGGTFKWAWLAEYRPWEVLRGLALAYLTVSWTAKVKEPLPHILAAIRKASPDTMSSPVWWTEIPPASAQINHPSLDGLVRCTGSSGKKNN